jgi:hypothetical protein
VLEVFEILSSSCLAPNKDEPIASPHHFLAAMFSADHSTNISIFDRSDDSFFGDWNARRSATLSN